MKIDENENENMHKYNSCTLYIVLFSILFTINVGIGTYFVYFHWYLKKDVLSLVLSLVLGLKQKFNYLTYKWEVQQINIKNRTYYFYNDMIKLKDFDSNLLKIDKKHYKGINIYYIGYITIKKIDDCESIYSVNPLYLLINHASRYIEEKNRNKYLIFDNSVNENKELLKNTQMFWMELIASKKQQMVVKKMIKKRITLKLNLILTMTCHYTSD